MYGKCPKFLTFFPYFFFFCLNFAFYAVVSKILNGMSNSVDPGQGAQEQSDMVLHCLHLPFCQKLWCTKF